MVVFSLSGRQIRRGLAVGALAAAAIAAGLLSGTRSGATLGTLDQRLTGNPVCSSLNFRGSYSSYSPLDQEFVPSVSQLQSVELCLTITSGTQVTLNIRDGTAASPGAILATRTVTAATTGFQWVLVNLPAALATTPGHKLVLEIPNSATFNWTGTCGQIGGTCTSLDPDLYPAGVSNRASILDFAFRTYASPPFMPGDSNTDGNITMLDAMLAAQYALNLIQADQLNPAAADVNCSGTVTMVDAMLIAQKAVHLISEFPMCSP
jgi:Dockerin type I domain